MNSVKYAHVLVYVKHAAGKNSCVLNIPNGDLFLLFLFRLHFWKTRPNRWTKQMVNT